MSEFINNNSIQRTRAITDFFNEITLNNSNGSEIVKKYITFLDQAQPWDVIIATDKLMLEDIDISMVKTGVNRGLNMLYKSLSSSPIPDYLKVPFFGSLHEENEELDRHLKEIKPLLQTVNKKDATPENIKNAISKIKLKINTLNDFNFHYLKKENILFPYIEKYLKQYHCLPLMWSYHDDIRNYISKLILLLKNNQPDIKKLNRLLGDLFFNMYAIRFREEFILFPVVIDMFSDYELKDMLHQSYEIGFAWISAPIMPSTSVKSKKEKSSEEKEPFKDKTLDFGTGKLTLQQAIMMLNHLPVDMTFVDENDEVRYFSNPDHRVFTRSKAIIGRKVENCHPPSSVHVVKNLVESFRKGQKTKESFWINMGPRTILIQYFALHDTKGTFRGTLEVSQDITEIKKLEGEKRLMDD